MPHVVFWLFFLCISITDANEYIEREDWIEVAIPHPLPEEWVLDNQVAPTDIILVILALNRLDPKQLVTRAKDVSDPRSPLYGQYLDKEQLIEATSVNPESVAVVKDWLQVYNVDYTFGPTLDMVHLQVTIAQVEQLFNTTVYLARNKLTQQTTHRASSVKVPSSIYGHLTTVFGFHGLPLPPRKTITEAAVVAYNVTPAVLYRTYNVSGVNVTRSTKNRQAVAEFQGQLMNKTDLSVFFKSFVPNSKAGDENVYKFVGGDKDGEGIEALLDIEYIMGVAPGIKTEFWIFPGSKFCADVVQWTQAILADDDAPLVHSVSYGWQGKLKKLGCQDSQITTIDSEFQKLAAKGITLIVASGDCGSGEGGERLTGKDKDKLLYPSWPASSPWVTAVGSTRFVNNAVGSGPEMATDQFGSGGGFSTMFPAPDYQTEAVKSYFANEPSSKLPSSGTYPPGGRATPDVCGLGEGYQVVHRTGVIPVGGTSASAPMFAALVSLINEARFAAGKPALGFLNPFIYQNPDVWMDVTAGNNRIGRGGETLKHGWDAIKGWDPATGLGSPNFAKILKAALA